MVSLIHFVNNHLLVSIEGNILMENSKDFQNSVQTLLAGYPALGMLTFDFRKVQFMDSSGMGILIRTVADLKKKNCTVNAVSLNKNLYAVFHLSGLHTIIKIHIQEDFYKAYPDFEKYKGI